MKTALLIGATGLVGSNLLDILLMDERIGRVKVFGRRPSGKRHEKLEEHIVDFDFPEDWSDLLRGDMAFSCLGSTRSKAGSKDTQYIVDYTYQFNFARTARNNGVNTFCLCSSAGADPNSWIFYLKMKGELDRDVQELGFEKLRILRPSQLYGERTDPRPTEKWYLRMVWAVTSINIFKKYRPIRGWQVASAMLTAAFLPEAGTRIFAFRELFHLQD